MGAAVRLVVTLFVRDRCALCEEAKLLVRQWLPEAEVRFEERDVDADPELRRLYGDWVPVGLHDGKELFRLRPERAELRRRLGLS